MLGMGQEYKKFVLARLVALNSRSSTQAAHWHHLGTLGGPLLTPHPK